MTCPLTFSVVPFHPDPCASKTYFMVQIGDHDVGWRHSRELADLHGKAVLEYIAANPDGNRSALVLANIEP